MSFGNALICSLLGMCVVFFALVLLMLIIKLMTAVGDRVTKKAAPVPEPASAPTPVAVGGIPAPDKDAPVLTLAAYAPGSAGDLKLYDTDPRTAAMLMAIVADELQAPLSELRFLSIRAIKEEND